MLKALISAIEYQWLGERTDHGAIYLKLPIEHFSRRLNVRMPRVTPALLPTGSYGC
jgi:hypothetical protein